MFVSLFSASLNFSSSSKNASVVVIASLGGEKCIVGVKILVGRGVLVGFRLLDWLPFGVSVIVGFTVDSG
jgi:hypothetical protein